MAGVPCTPRSQGQVWGVTSPHPIPVSIPIPAGIETWPSHSLPPWSPQHPAGLSTVPTGDPPGTHLPQPQSVPDPGGTPSEGPAQGRRPGIPPLGGVCATRGPPFLHTGVGTCSVLGGPSFLPRVICWGPHSIPRCSSLCSGGPRSHQGVPRSLSVGSSPCPRGSHLPF